jgi:fructose-bisphosphate aldolase class II
MIFTPVKVLLQDAEKNGYAVGAFNISNMEIAQAVISAARACGSPVILAVSEGVIKYAGLNYITAIAREAAESVTVPVALHLDHGTNLEQLYSCIKAGFSSVMFDGSKLPIEQNIAVTRKVVEAARKAGVSVEAEIGRISGVEDNVSVSEREAFLTEPEEALSFAEQTRVDSLAVAIGTAHGRYRGEPKLDFERLSKISSSIQIPIVLHGCSGVPSDAILRAIALGVRKINIDTDIRQTFIETIRHIMKTNPDEIDPRKILGPARQAVAEMLKAKMSLFGSAGKAGKTVS